MDLAVEKTKTLSTQEVYEIIDFAVQAAEDNGFLNSFVFERALYCFAAMRFYPERVEEIAGMMEDQSPLVAWDTLLEDGTVDKMLEENSVDLENLAQNGQVWFEEFNEYAHSARGLLNTIQDFSGDIVRQAAEQLKAASDNQQFQEVKAIAESWGMNNATNKSLFANA